MFSFLRKNIFHPADDAAGQADLDAMGMKGGLCENVLNHPFGQPAGALILLLNHLDPGSRFNVRTVCSIHFATIRKASAQLVFIL